MGISRQHVGLEMNTDKIQNKNPRKDALNPSQITRSAYWRRKALRLYILIIGMGTLNLSNAETPVIILQDESIGSINNIPAELAKLETEFYRTGEPGWVTVSESRTFSNSVSPDKAKQELLQILRNDAISKKIPANVEVSSLLTDLMGETDGVAIETTVWSGFFRTTVSGVITDEKIVRDTTVFEGSGYRKEITLKAYVEPVKGQRDPGFYVDVGLENSMLKKGDELAFSVSPSKDCYLYVFNLMADQNIMLMFPNDYMKENFVSAGETIQIPALEIRNYVKFRVALMPGENLTAESVYIVCSREEVPMIRDLPTIGTGMPVFSGESQSFVKLQRWLTNIPLNQRVEKNLVYHVSKY